MKLKEKILTGLLVLVLVVSGTIRYLQIEGFNTALTYDQARDLLDIRVLAGFHDFKVSGPTTSITGLNLGPFYYYFNLLPFWIGGGNPQALVYWNILWFLIAGVMIYGFFWRKNIILGFLISTIFLMSPQLFSVSRYFWNANAVVYFVVFYFLGLWNFIENNNKISAIVLGVTAGLVIQFEAAFGSLCVAFSILVVLLRNRMVFKNYLLGLLPWFLPQLVFEIKNNFRMTKLFVGMLTGENTILGEKVPWEQVLNMHWKTIVPFFEGQFMLPYGFGFGLVLLALLIILVSKKYKRVGWYLIGFIFFTFAYYTVIYHHELKMWYLEGIRVWYCFVIGLAMVSVSKLKGIFYVILCLFLLTSFFSTIGDQKRYISENRTSNDPKKMINLVKNIDWIYEEMDGRGFRAYNYVPEVYDYSTQYLYWWYGVNTYGYMPEEVSYSITYVPEYVRMGGIFYKKSKPSEDGLIALIYETKSTYKDWLGQFKEYCLLNKQETNWNTTVEIRKKCVF